MLDMSFLSKDGQSTNCVQLGEDFFLWLAKSQFSKIGLSIDTQINVDEEDVVLPLVELNKDIRQKIGSFLRDAIIRESDAVLNKLGDSPSKEEYQNETYRLRKLHELLKCVENENYHYLQRVQF